MLTIENFKKIRNQWFGDWQIGKTEEGSQYYALQARHKNGRDSVTLVMFREGTYNMEWSEVTYDIKISKDGTSDVIEDIIYKNTLDDMQMFGEALVHYLNTI